MTAAQQATLALLSTHAPPVRPAPARIVINGRSLPRSFQLALGLASVAPGHYWYDPVSGLWGGIGFSSGGQLAPGLPLGKPAPDASRGNTGVFVNGRELRRSERARFEAVHGYLVAGQYAVDSDGVLQWVRH